MKHCDEKLLLRMACEEYVRISRSIHRTDLLATSPKADDAHGLEAEARDGVRVALADLDEAEGGSK